MIKVLWTWLALMALLAATYLLARAPLGAAASLAASTAVAAAKTLLVALIFMELDRSRWAQRLAAAAALVIVGILLTGSLQDYLTRPRDAWPLAPRVSGPDLPSERRGGAVLPDEGFSGR